MAHKKNNNVQYFTIMQIMICFFLSVLFIWIVGYYFCNSFFYYEYDEKLNKYIPSPNRAYIYKSEGFGTTYIGASGVNAIGDIAKESRKKIAIWGDSYIEAHQISDRDKIPQLVTTKLKAKGLGENLICFGVGMSGDSVADYYFDIPQYEHLTKNIVSHFILITDIDETLPDLKNENNKGVFKSKPLNLNYQPVERNLRFQKIKKLLNSFYLYFLGKPIDSVYHLKNKVRFTPGKKNQDSNTDESKEIVYSDKFLFDSWSFLLKKLREQTELPISFVYSPQIPIIQDGRISSKDNNANHIALFTEIAKEHDITVLNTTDEFVSFYRKAGLFPRGFSNSKPSRGHFNENGHKIIAEIIMTHINASLLR